MKYKIVLEQDEDGIFIAECPTLPGCISQGNTRQEAIDNIKDAIKGYLKSVKKHNELLHPSTKEDLEFARRTEEAWKRYENLLK